MLDAHGRWIREAEQDPTHRARVSDALDLGARVLLMQCATCLYWREWQEFQCAAPTLPGLRRGDCTHKDLIGNSRRPADFGCTLWEVR